MAIPVPVGLHALATALMVWANTVTGLPIPDDVNFGVGVMPEGVGAMYLDGPEVIVAPEGLYANLDKPMAAAILLHELVHAMQDEAGWMDAPDKDRVTIERLAYETMFKYLEKIGLGEMVTELRADPNIQIAMGADTVAGEIFAPKPVPEGVR